MKTKVKKTTYEAHGREFTDQAKAEHFEKLVAAKEAFEDARNNLGRVLAESFMTADGQPFSFQHWTYYYILQAYDRLPRLFPVDFIYWGWNFDAYQYGDDTDLVLFSAKDPQGNECDRSHGYRISELYADRVAAAAALKIAQRKWLDQQLADLNEQAES